MPLISVVAETPPLVTAAPAIGTPFSSTTLPFRLAVTVCSAGKLLGLGLEGSLVVPFLLQASIIMAEVARRTGTRGRKGFFKGSILWLILKNALAPLKLWFLGRNFYVPHFLEFILYFRDPA